MLICSWRSGSHEFGSATFNQASNVFAQVIVSTLGQSLSSGPNAL
jgi:hypothetical protein